MVSLAESRAKRIKDQGRTRNKENKGDRRKDGTRRPLNYL
jgi:hypothetical protein